MGEKITRENNEQKGRVSLGKELAYKEWSGDERTQGNRSGKKI